jgi:hypothetical protein
LLTALKTVEYEPVIQFCNVVTNISWLTLICAQDKENYLYYVCEAASWADKVWFGFLVGAKPCSAGDTLDSRTAPSITNNLSSTRERV